MDSKILGVILIVAGILLGIWGYNLYDSVGSSINRSFGGDAPLEAWAALIGGGVSFLIGIKKVL